MSSRKTPRWQSKGTVVMGTVLIAAAAFATTTRTWLDVVLPQTSVQTPDIAVAGSEAATAVTAFAVVALASALAASIAGRIARWVVSAILLVSGLGVAAASYLIISDPAQGAAGAIGKAIGVSGGDDIQITLTAMPWLAFATGILIALAGVWMAVAGRHWTSSRRYAVPAAAADTEAAAENGTTPEKGAAPGEGEGTTPAAGGATAAGGTGDGTTEEDIDEIDSWDRLSRGEDPTR